MATVYPVAAGGQNYSGIMIPEVWSPLLNVKFYDATCLSSITNNKYEGDIAKQGDTVQIRTIPSITIRDYRKGQTLTFETPVAEKVQLLIDKGKSWSFVLDKVDIKQMDLNAIAEWTKDAGQQLKIAIETDVFGVAYASAHANNKGLTAGVKSAAYSMGVSGTPLALTSDNILETIVNCGSVLDEQNVPDDDRWITLPPLFVGMIKLSELKDASFSGDRETMLRRGAVGTIDRFTVFKSNLVSSTTDGSDRVWHCMAGHKSAITFASQLTESGQNDNPTGFGTLVKGLQVYGYKVVKPESLIDLYVKKGTVV